MVCAHPRAGPCAIGTLELQSACARRLGARTRLSGGTSPVTKVDPMGTASGPGDIVPNFANSLDNRSGRTVTVRGDRAEDRDQGKRTVRLDDKDMVGNGVGGLYDWDTVRVRCEKNGPLYCFTAPSTGTCLLRCVTEPDGKRVPTIACRRRFLPNAVLEPELCDKKSPGTSGGGTLGL